MKMYIVKTINSLGKENIAAICKSYKKAVEISTDLIENKVVFDSWVIEEEFEEDK